MADSSRLSAGPPPPPERKPSTTSRPSRPLGLRPVRGSTTGGLAHHPSSSSSSPPRRSSSGQDAGSNPLLVAPSAALAPSFRSSDSARGSRHGARLTPYGDPDAPSRRRMEEEDDDLLPAPPNHKKPASPQVPFRYTAKSGPGVSGGGGSNAGGLQHNHARGVECLACVVEKQRGDLEGMRLRLAHATSEAASLRQQQDLLHRERPRSPTSTTHQQSSLQGIGNSLNYYKEQIRQLKFAVAQAEAGQSNTETLLREALQRPPIPPPVPIKDSGAQTFGLDQIDVLVNGERPDSEASVASDDDVDYGSQRRSVRSGAWGPEEKANLIGEMRTAVDAGVASALQKSSWLFGKQGTQTRDVEDSMKKDMSKGAIPRLVLDAFTGNAPEEIFYEMCASLGEAHAVNENQAIQVNNASSFWKLMHSGILTFEEGLVSQIEHYETLTFLASRIPPVSYCNNPLGFLFAQIIKTREDAESMAKRQEEITQAQVYGLGRKMDDTRGGEDEEPNYNLWTDLLKRLIILLSRNTHCLQTQVVIFNYETPTFTGLPEIQQYAPLEFAVEYHLDEVVLLICDAQERLPVDYWECIHGYPFHNALCLGHSSENAIRYMLRAASTVPDDRFGILKNDKDQPEETPAFYLALKYAHDIHGVIDDLLDLLVKRNFKLNLKWTGWTEKDPREEWHLLQWAAYQGVDRVFKLTRTHPDFFQKCQTAHRKPPGNGPPKGNQPLHLACLSGSVTVVETLCQEISQVLKAYTGPIWNEGQTPLHIAAQQCHYRCIDKILELAKDKWGWSAKIQEEKLFGKIQAKTRWTKQSDDFEYSVYNMALLTLVYRRHVLRTLETSPEDDEEMVANNEDEIVRHKREIEIANYQVKFLNEKHSEKLRSFAEVRINMRFYPWMIFIGLVTFFAASETAWFSDFHYYSALAIQRHFDSIVYSTPGGQEKDLHNLDNQFEVQEWIHTALLTMPDTFVFAHAASVGATRLRQIIIRNDSCTVGPTFFRQSATGPQTCSGAVSNQRASLFFIDWLFESLLQAPRDDHTQATEPITLLSGAKSFWRPDEWTKEGSYFSPLGQEYPGSGYIMDFDWNNETAYKTSLRDMRGTVGAPFGKDGWLSLGTRALFFATTFYNPATDQYISGYVAFEMPSFGGVFVKARWQSLRLIRNYDNYLDYFIVAVEILLAAIVILMFIRTILEFMYLLKGHFKGFTLRKSMTYIWGAVKKVGTGSNVLEIVTIGMFLAVFTWRLMIRKEAQDLENLFEQHLQTDGVLETSFFFPFESIASHHATRLSSLGLVLMLVYLKILVIVRLHRNVGPISIAIVQTLFNMRIFYFSMILSLFLLSLSFAAYFAYGEFAGEFSSLFKSLLSLFRIIFGEYWEFDKVRREQPLYGPLLLLSMLLFGSLLLINVMTAIIFDIYREKNQQSEGSWETDLVDMQINDLLHTLYRKGVRLRNEEQNQKGSWFSALLESVQSNAALNKSEVADIIEWNRALIFFKVYKGVPSLFPDPMHGNKALKDFVEEERTTERMLELITEKVSGNYDRTEVVEKQMKDMNKLVMEIHERLFPKARIELASSRFDTTKEDLTSPLKDGGDGSRSAFAAALAEDEDSDQIDV